MEYQKAKWLAKYAVYLAKFWAEQKKSTKTLHPAAPTYSALPIKWDFW